MSYTEIYRITKAGNTKFEGEIKNSHRGAAAVWNYLEDKYLPPVIKYGQKFPRMIGGEMQEVWDLQEDLRLSESERICLLSTFDNVLVGNDDLPKLCRAFREFGGQTSLPEQAAIIEGMKQDKRYIAVCWNQTSVNADIPPENIKDKFWNLFDALTSK